MSCITNDFQHVLQLIEYTKIVTTHLSIRLQELFQLLEYMYGHKLMTQTSYNTRVNELVHEIQLFIRHGATDDIPKASNTDSGCIGNSIFATIVEFYVQYADCKAHDQEWLYIQRKLEDIFQEILCTPTFCSTINTQISPYDIVDSFDITEDEEIDEICRTVQQLYERLILCGYAKSISWMDESQQQYLRYVRYQAVCQQIIEERDVSCPMYSLLPYDGLQPICPLIYEYINPMLL